jgi:hypothetical protein
VLKNGKVVITGLRDKNVKDISFPNNVIDIYTSFYRCESLKEIVIPESVKCFDTTLMFSDCKKLERVVIKGKIKKIKWCCFSNCTSLKEVVLPNTVTYIEEGAFANCESLTKITLPESLQYIGPLVFRGCKNLINIDIPKNVNSIGGWAFKDCISLTSINIPNGDIDIDSIAFKDSGLKEIRIDSHACVDDADFEELKRKLPPECKVIFIEQTGDAKKIRTREKIEDAD